MGAVSADCACACFTCGVLFSVSVVEVALSAQNAYAANANTAAADIAVLFFMLFFRLRAEFLRVGKNRAILLGNRARRGSGNPPELAHMQPDLSVPCAETGGSTFQTRLLARVGGVSARFGRLPAPKGSGFLPESSRQLQRRDRARFSRDFRLSEKCRLPIFVSALC